MDEKLTDKEAQEYLRTSRSVLALMRKNRKIPYQKVGGKVIYLRSDLDAFFKDCRVPAVNDSTR